MPKLAISMILLSSASIGTLVVMLLGGLPVVLKMLPAAATPVLVACAGLALTTGLGLLEIGRDSSVAQLPNDAAT